MDAIEGYLHLIPVPGLQQYLSVFKLIWSLVKQVQASKSQLFALARSIAQLMVTLNAEYQSGKLTLVKTSTPLNNLRRLLDEVTAFVQKQRGYGFLKSLYVKDERIMQIEDYHRRICDLITVFQISALVDIQDWQARNDAARVEDQQALHNRLGDLEANQNKLNEVLDVQQSNIMAIMVSLQRLTEKAPGGREREFFSNSLQYLSTASGQHAVLESWTITSFDVEFGPEIGTGGFGQVFKGTWEKTTVALKVLKTDKGAAPSSNAILREVNTWSKLGHPHILQFLGANILDDKPFIVMPYLKNGNARDYIESHPDCDRLKILHHISLGLVYLHNHNIVHGDLKAMNVLIDDGERGVLCDFGLSRVKADATSRTARIGGHIVTGSRNWMATELLLGGSLRKPCDIYSYGMTVYEIFTNEIPLANIAYTDFVELVVKHDTRPQRPEEDEAPGLSDEVWKLAESCWVKTPTERPNADEICDTISHLIDTRVVSPVIRSPPPLVSSPAKLSPAAYPPSPEYFEHERFTNTPLHSPQVTSYSPDVGKFATIAKTSPPPIPISTRRSLSPQSSSQPLPYETPMSLPLAVSKLEIDTEICTILEHPNWVTSVAVSYDGDQIISGCYDHMIRIWDMKTGRMVLGPLHGHTARVTSIALSPDGKHIVSGSMDCTIRVWDATTGHAVANPFKGLYERVVSVIFSPNGGQIISSSIDRKIRVWDAQTGRVVLILNGTTNVFSPIAVSPNGNYIVSGYKGNTAGLWDSMSGRTTLKPLKGHAGPVCTVAFSPDGNYIVTGGEDCTLRVWNAKTGNELFHSPLRGHTEGVNCIAFSPDGRRIASGSKDNTVRVWSVELGGEESGPHRGHTRWITSVKFSPNGRHIISGSYDKTIRIWDATKT